MLTVSLQTTGLQRHLRLSEGEFTRIEPFLASLKTLMRCYPCYIPQLQAKVVNQGDLVVFNGSEGVRIWELVQQFVQPEDLVYNPEKDE